MERNEVSLLILKLLSVNYKFKQVLMSDIPGFVSIGNSSQYLKWKGKKDNGTFFKFTVIFDGVMCFSQSS